MLLAQNREKKCPLFLSSSNSEVERTLTTDCFFNRLSFDQRGQSKARATAKYSASFGSGDTLFASFIQCSYSSYGKILICARRISKAVRTSSSGRLALATSSGKYLSSSFSINSGDMNSSRNEENRLRVLPSEATSAEKRVFASTTSSMEHQTPYALTCCSWMPARTFLPNSKASRSVNFDSAAMAFSMRSWDNFSRIASRATAAQSMSLCSSISFLKSSGTVNVIVAILPKKVIPFFKPFAA